MASVSRDKDGRVRILFHAGGKRHTIRLGKPKERAIRAFRDHLDDLIESRKLGRLPDRATRRWLEALTDRQHRHLAEAGLVDPRDQKSVRPVTLGEFIDRYIAGRQDIKPHTRDVMRQAADDLTKYFGADRLLTSINAGEATKFRLWQISRRCLSENTVRRRCGIARQFWKAAIDEGLVVENPWKSIPTNVHGNSAKVRFITDEETRALLEAAPNAEWRLLIGLARYGGLRIPSEALALTWGDINWGRKRFLVHSVKTEHLPGHETRIVPIFPELEPLLLDCWTQQGCPGPTAKVLSIRDPCVNLRTRLVRIVRRAGLTPWPRPWHNLRASRATELTERFPIKTVITWLGHSVDVALEHYLSVPESHFEQATEKMAHKMAHLTVFSSDQGAWRETDAAVVKHINTPKNTVDDS